MRVPNPFIFGSAAELGCAYAWEGPGSGHRHLYSVKWFKDNVELDKEDESKFVQDKDIMGNCTLKILDASKEDSGKFTCKIVGKIRLVGEEKKEKCVTKTKVTIKGTLSLKGCQSMKNSINT